MKTLKLNDKNMKKFLVVLGLLALVGGSIYLIHNRKSPAPATQQGLAGGYSFRAPTQATSSIGSATQTLVLSADSARQFASFCNSTTTTASYISLQIGATSTSPSGIQIPGGSCYEMAPEKGNLFTTAVYGQTTAGTSTLTVVTQSLAN